MWDRDETIDYIISECSKLARKEYKTRHDWVGRVIHRELCKKLKFDHTNKWYIHNPTSVRENERDKLQWDFEIQTNHLISARRQDPIIINNKKIELVIFLMKEIQIKIFNYDVKNPIVKHYPYSSYYKSHINVYTFFYN